MTRSRRILSRFRADDPLEHVTPVAAAGDLLAARDQARAVHVAADVEGYIVDLVRATRAAGELTLGASPRSALALMRAAQALAALAGRAYVVPDDVAALAVPVLAHRLLLSRDAAVERRRPESVDRAPAGRGGRARRSDGRRLARAGPGGLVPPSAQLRTVMVCAVAGVAAGLIVGSRALVVGALTALLLGAVVAYCRRHVFDRLSYSRALSHRVVGWGAEVEVRFEVRNRKWLPVLWMRVRDRWPAAVEPARLLAASRRRSHRQDLRPALLPALVGEGQPPAPGRLPPARRARLRSGLR